MPLPSLVGWKPSLQGWRPSQKGEGHHFLLLLGRRPMHWMLRWGCSVGFDRPRGAARPRAAWRGGLAAFEFLRRRGGRFAGTWGETLGGLPGAKSGPKRHGAGSENRCIRLGFLLLARNCCFQWKSVGPRTVEHSIDVQVVASVLTAGRCAKEHLPKRSSPFTFPFGVLNLCPRIPTTIDLIASTKPPWSWKLICVVPRQSLEPPLSRS